MNAAKWIPSIMAILLPVLTIAGPQIQAWQSAHPNAMAIMGAIALILYNLVQSPIKPPTPVQVSTTGPVVVTPSDNQQNQEPPPPIN